ncbi:hypothetical protein GE09DRAFT_1215771 [Coniochaeta sp. 2T2.1]|nr:hypothetical protein GE09DRAFT_1215771 [Coniochaeta sp. 2T2.1]
MGWLWHSNGDSTAKREAEINGSPAQTSQLQPDSQQPQQQLQPSSQHENPYLKEETTAGPESNPPMRMEGPDVNPETNPQRLRHANERFKDEGCCSDLKDAKFWEICCMSNALTV